MDIRWSLLVASLAACTSAYAQAPSSNVTASVLRTAGTSADPNAGSWLSYGKTQGETRYSPLKQIDTSNVSRLGLSWTYTLGAGGGNQEGTPLVWNNTIYGITTWNVVFALDAKTGKQIWRWDPEVNQATVRPKTCCGIVARGMAIYDGKIFAPVIDGRLVALNALTGKVVWEARLGYSVDWQSITMAPRIAGNKVVIGMAGGDHPTRGHIDAFDTATGHRLWRFYTVPGAPDQPYENEAMRKAAATWDKNFDFKKWGGGGAVWDGMAYDPIADLVYVGTGNAEPWVEKFRGSNARVGNLYTCSILAINATTGQLKWYYQAVPDDNWDYDNVQQLMLADITVRGKARKVIMQAPKNGFYYILDRISGEFISAQPFVRVNWAKGVDDKGKPMINPEAFYDKEPITLYPTAGGAHNWSPMSYNPATGFVYIPASDSSWTFQAGDEVIEQQTGHTGLSRTFPQARPNGLKIIGPDPLPGNPRGTLVAWDPAKQQVAWRAPTGGGIGGGTVTTAGNLVMQVTNDGHLYAYSADKGEKLLDVNVGRTGMAPPITYEVDGKQYVAFLGGMGKPANQVGLTDAKVDYPPMLFALELDGKEAMPTPVPAPSFGPRPAAGAKPPAGPSPVVPANDGLHK